MGTPQEPLSPTEVVTSQETGSGTNPAWNDVLSVIPESLHPAITPHFQKWDQAAQTRIEDLNSQLKGYEQYSNFAQHGITREQLEQGLLLIQEINQNPKSIYDALVDSYPDLVKQATEQGITPPVADGSQFEDPRFAEYKQQLDTVSQIILQQEEAKQNAAADARLDQELSAAAEKFPNVVMNQQTEQYILTQMMVNNQTAEQAFQNFVDFTTALTGQPFSPQVMGSSGGGVPSQALDPTKLSRNETVDLVAQYVAKMNQNR